ncbi:hypothetical protein KFU94_52760 [Chloroflexi bacterium TSY]|nr:hypothetical protein [Chloroflexi bacterium TSY]
MIVAGCLAFAVGLIHSILGEILIFRHMRKDSLIPTDGSPVLKERYVRILWATWHTVTIFGWGFAAILFQLSFSSSQHISQEFVKNTILFSMLIVSLIVLVGTKGKHPGWLGLLGIAIFLWIG